MKVSLQLGPILLVFLAALGCPRGSLPGIASSGDAIDDRAANLGLPPSERRALRAEVSRRLLLLEAAQADAHGAGPLASRRRLQGTLNLLDAWDEIEAAGGAPRDSERAALRAAGAWLVELPTTEVAGAPAAVVVADDGPFARALVAKQAGDLDAAVQEGLLALQQLVDSGVDSAALRYRLGEWASQLGDGDLAAELFETAVVVARGQDWITERGPIDAARARAAALGPERAALAEAHARVAAGDLGPAHDQLQRLARDAQDGAVRADADTALRALLAQAESRALADLARADALLVGPGPYEGVAPLLDGVSALPAAAVDQAELRRLLAWQQERTRASSDGERAAQQASAEANLAEARRLVVARDYRAGIAAFQRLDGTTAQAIARREAREAAETLVREERERAGALFVAAKKQPDPQKKRVALDEVRSILAGVLAEFPDTSFADRLRANLAAVDQEIRTLGPS